MQKNFRHLLSLILVVGISIAAWELVLRKEEAKISGTRIDPTRDVPDAVLTGADGKHFALSSLHGQWVLVFFGFLNCPDTCPTTMAHLSKEYARLLENRKFAKVLFVSLDPQRDTPEKLGKYAAFYGDGIITASANEETLRSLTHALATTFDRTTKQADGSYTVNHSGDIFLLDPDGEWYAVYRPPLTIGQISDDVRELILRSL